MGNPRKSIKISQEIISPQKVLEARGNRLWAIGKSK